jgi:hypothetical protein
VHPARASDVLVLLERSSQNVFSVSLDGGLLSHARADRATENANLFDREQ